MVINRISQTISDEEAQRRALDRMAEVEKTKAMQDFDNAVARAAEERQARKAHQAEAEADFVNRLRDELQGLYAQRRKHAEASIKTLSAFAEVELALRDKLAELDRTFTQLAVGFDGADRLKMLAELRGRAGLPPEHDRTGAPVPATEAGAIAAAALRGVMGGLIGPMCIKAGPSVVTFK